MTTKLLDLSWNANAIPAMQIVGTRAALFTFKTHMAGFVWDAAQLENNPYTFVELKRCLMVSLLAGIRSVILSRC